jgi:hypothetical protein
MKKQIVCINWGTRYGPRFINRLYAMVARNITPPFSFTCFTDSDQGVRPEVDCQPLPPLDFVMPKNTKGKWPKARLWSKTLGTLTGPVLFLDLDLVITGNLDEFFSYGDPDQVILARNPAKPFERVGQTSVFRFPVGKLYPLQERFLADPQAVADEYRYEQRFVTRNAPGGVELFPRRWVQHFRYQCMPTFPLNLALEPRLPEGAKIVIFPGGVLPEHAIRGGWAGREGWSLGQHLRGVTERHEDGSRWRYLRHYIKPTKWVEEVWHE